MATMERIYYWRTKLSEARHSLDAAYQSLPAGTKVIYRYGGKDITVEIIEHWGAHRCRVKNPKTGREYLLEYDAIGKIAS